MFWLFVVVASFSSEKGPKALDPESLLEVADPVAPADEFFRPEKEFYDEEKYCAIDLTKWDCTAYVYEQITEPQFRFNLQILNDDPFARVPWTTVRTLDTHHTCAGGLKWGKTYRIIEDETLFDTVIDGVDYAFDNWRNGQNYFPSFKEGQEREFTCSDLTESNCTAPYTTYDFHNFRDYGTLKICKSDYETSPNWYGGAKFEVRCWRSTSTGTVLSAQYTTFGEDGVICNRTTHPNCGCTPCIGPIPLGVQCKITEIEPPLNFVLNEEITEIAITSPITLPTRTDVEVFWTFDADAQKTYATKIDDGSLAEVHCDGGNAETVIRKNEREKVCFTIRKCEDGTGGDNCVPVPDTQFKVDCYDVSNQPIGGFTNVVEITDSRGLIEINCLPKQANCTALEIRAPDGYRPDTTPQSTGELLDVCECIPEGDLCADDPCPLGDDCQIHECDPSSGLCILTPKADGLECEGGVGTCFGGICEPTCATQLFNDNELPGSSTPVDDLASAMTSVLATGCVDVDALTRQDTLRECRALCRQSISCVGYAAYASNRCCLVSDYDSDSANVISSPDVVFYEDHCGPKAPVPLPSCPNLSSCLFDLHSNFEGCHALGSDGFTRGSGATKTQNGGSIRWSNSDVPVVGGHAMCDSSIEYTHPDAGLTADQAFGTEISIPANSEVTMRAWVKYGSPVVFGEKEVGFAGYSSDASLGADSFLNQVSQRPFGLEQYVWTQVQRTFSVGPATTDVLHLTFNGAEPNAVLNFCGFEIYIANDGVCDIPPLSLS